MPSYVRQAEMLTDSEIHASLRRLEDADYISEQVMSQNMSVMADNVDEVDQRLTKSVNDLNNEAYQLHTYIEPHLYNDDLQFFQTIYVGSFMVSDGGYITGDVTIDNGGSLTVDGTIMANNGVDIYDGTLFTPSVTMQTGGDLSEYTPHTFTIEGTPLTGTILSTQDMSFSLVGLVEGNASGDIYTMRTIQNHIDLLSVTVEPHISYDTDVEKFFSYTNLKDPQGTVVLASSNVYAENVAYELQSLSIDAHIEYDTTLNKYYAYADLKNSQNVVVLTSSDAYAVNVAYDLESLTVESHITYDTDTHKYYAYANLKDSEGTVVKTSTNVWSGTEAYDAGRGSGGSTYTHSATMEWFETVNNIPRFKKTSGDWIGYDPVVVHW